MQNKNDEHIDQVFRNGLKDLQVIPPSEVWSSVSGKIPAAFQIRLTRIVAAAAMILIIAGAGWLIFINNPESSSIVEQNGQELKPGKSMVSGSESGEIAVISDYENDEGRLGDFDETERVKEIIENKNLTRISSQGSESRDFLLPIATPLTSILTANSDPVFSLSFQNYLIPLQPLTSSPSGSLIEDTKALTIDLTKYQNIKHSSWAISGNISPLYSFRNANTPEGLQDKSYYHSQESGSRGYTGGINAIYNAKRRLSFQAGIQYSRGGLSVNEIIFYEDIRTGNIVTTGILRKNIPYPIETSIGQISSGEYESYLSNYVKQDGTLFNEHLSAMPEFEKYESFETNIIQDFKFLEVPLLVRYKIIDRRFGMNVLSGVGASFLVDNEVFIYHQGQKIPLGHTDKIRTTNFIGTFGIGFEYSVTPKLSLNIEPTLKYFLNSFNVNGGISTHPYYMGVYSGLSLYF